VAQQDLLTYAIRTLDAAGIDYMVTGSIVSSLQGEPRSTHDVDVIVAIQSQHTNAILEAFARPRYYVDRGAIQEALDTGGVFNVIDTHEGDKIDFWMLTDSAFDRTRFGRRYAEDVFGIRMNVSSPEDTILAKLNWAKVSGGGERYVRDALGVYQVQEPLLDTAYLDEWSQRLEVDDLLARVRSEARKAS
jgi:hypothetical protein